MLTRSLGYGYLIAVLLAGSVILLGAYTRLTDAGLGCPDWPGCYGQLSAPSTEKEIHNANQAYPDNPVHVGKARTEMSHRYLAESLGGLIFILALLSYFKRRSHVLPLWLPALLVILVCAQGMLGMWTVTLRLLPIVVLAHLLGGFCTLALLWLGWLYFSGRHGGRPADIRTVHLALLTLAALIIQITLGGWTSTNYAALICPDFPFCQTPAPTGDFIHAFSIFGGFKDSAARVTIHMAHRLGACLVLILSCILAYRLWPHAKAFSLGLLAVLGLQLGLGITNVLLTLPLPIAVAHNGVAAMLLLILITLTFRLYHDHARLLGTV